MLTCRMRDKGIYTPQSQDEGNLTLTKQPRGHLNP